MEVYYDFFCTSCVTEAVISYPAFRSSSGDAPTHRCVVAHWYERFNIVKRHCTIASPGSSPCGAISFLNHKCKFCVNGVCCAGRNVVYEQCSDHFDRSAIVIDHSFSRDYSADTASQHSSDDLCSGYNICCNGDANWQYIDASRYKYCLTADLWDQPGPV